MEKANFTAARVASFACEPGKQQSIFWDKKTPGLGLRVSSGGARAYVFESRLHGKTLRVTIGDQRVWDLGKAQTEAAKLKILVDGGKDPREVKAEERAALEARQVEARRKTATVAEAWVDYLEYLRTRISPKTKKPRSERYLADHAALAAPGGEMRKRGTRKTTRGPLAPLMALRLSDLSAGRIAAWLESEAQMRPTNAAHAFRLLKAFIRWCESHDTYGGVVPADSYNSSKVAGVLPRSNAKQGDVLQREQLSAWFNAVAEIQNPVISAYLQALLITGARREEMAGLKWSGVDFQWRSMHISDKVEDAGRTIPLTPYLAFLLQNLKRINDTPPTIRQLRRLQGRGEEWQPSAWVFASKTAADGKIAEPRYAHNQALAAAGLPHVSLHGLRRSFATLSEWVECPVGVVAQIQGHKPSAIAEKHYRRRPLDLLRMWHDRIEFWMLEQAGVEFKSEQAKPELWAVGK